MEERAKLRKKVFVDTNILLSGSFFYGNEAKLLSFVDIDLYTSDFAIEEATNVIKRKFISFKTDDLQYALEKFNYSLMDFYKIVKREYYIHKFKFAKEMIGKEKDALILAAVLSVNPDYFVSGDIDFFKPLIRKIVNIYKTAEVLKILGF